MLKIHWGVNDDTGVILSESITSDNTTDANERASIGQRGAEQKTQDAKVRIGELNLFNSLERPLRVLAEKTPLNKAKLEV